MQAHLIFPDETFTIDTIKILLFDCRENGRSFSTRVFTVFFRILRNFLCKSSRGKGATTSKFQGVASRCRKKRWIN